MKLATMKDLYTHELKDLYDAESRLLDALPRMQERASSNELKQIYADHIDSTKKHRDRIADLCRDLGEEPAGETCEGVQGLVTETQEIINATGDENTIDAALIAMSNRMQHYEMAGYGAARAHAEVIGKSEHARALQSTLNDEGETDHKLTTLAGNLNAACPC